MKWISWIWTPPDWFGACTPERFWKEFDSDFHAIFVSQQPTLGTKMSEFKNIEKLGLVVCHGPSGLPWIRAHDLERVLSEVYIIMPTPKPQSADELLREVVNAWKGSRSISPIMGRAEEYLETKK